MTVKGIRLDFEMDSNEPIRSEQLHTSAWAGAEKKIIGIRFYSRFSP